MFCADALLGALVPCLHMIGLILVQELFPTASWIFPSCRQPALFPGQVGALQCLPAMVPGCQKLVGVLDDACAWSHGGYKDNPDSEVMEDGVHDLNGMHRVW